MPAVRCVRYGSPTRIHVGESPGGFTCYGWKNNDPTAKIAKFGYAVPCLSSSYYDVAAGTTLSPTWTSWSREHDSVFGAAGTPAANAGATYDSLWAGNATGSYNNVKPKFTNFSLSDQFRPNDRFLINASIRYDNFTYDLPNSATDANEFYANMSANYSCVLASTNQVLTAPLPPGSAPPAADAIRRGNCDKAATALNPAGPHTGWVHPNGTTQNGIAAPDFTATSPSSYSLDYWEPRFSATYTQSPDVVWRVSAGRFTQPPISASVQYSSLTATTARYGTTR